MEAENDKKHDFFMVIVVITFIFSANTFDRRSLPPFPTSQEVINVIKSLEDALVTP